MTMSVFAALVAFVLTLAAAETDRSLRSADLPAPTNLLVDLVEAQAAPLMLVTSTALPSFSFAAEPDSGAHTVRMTHYRIVVSQLVGGKRVWDSKSVPGEAQSVLCGAVLSAGTTYEWTAQYWSHGRASPVSTGQFDVGLLNETDWGGSVWLGGGHRQFKLPLASVRSQLAEPGRLKLHVASPGGATVQLDQVPVGDPVGIMLWTDASKSVPYISYDLTDLTHASEIIITCGGGFWGSQHGHGHGKAPAARIVLMHETGSQKRMLVQSGSPGVNGRVGPILADDPWGGATTDLTLADASNWHPAKLAPDTPGYAPTGVLFPLPAPYATTRGAFRAISVSAVHQRPGAFLYKFPANIVGFASVNPGHVSGPGNLTLEYCEQWNHTAGGCVPFGVPPFPTPLPRCELNGCDTFVLPSTNLSKPLEPKFTWHGFQWVLVAPSAGATFTGRSDALVAHWSTVNLTESSTISFGGSGSRLLSGIRDIVKASQISNLAGFMPTDCPTREKHGWLGDMQVTAEEAMYNLWSPSIFNLFLSQIRDSQLSAGAKTNAGFVAGVVPGTTSSALPGSDGKSSGLDISWTAAYPLGAGWLVKYYGATPAVQSHWESIKLYMDGQLATAGADGLPDFWTWGDWCAVQDRAKCTPGTGAQAAAANFLLALQSMVYTSTALDSSKDAERYNTSYMHLKGVYNSRFWNDEMQTWASDPMELQTLTSLSLGAGVGSPKQRAAAIEALDRDIVGRGYHLTVGSAGAKWLLRTLSQVGKHDTALKLAMQETQPSWGYWLSQGATTCWENWSGEADASHPPTPTHNHIFLCGGVGEWMYESLAGIVPTGPGYSTVDIKPLISKTLGPSSVDATVQTVRGAISSKWSRATEQHANTTNPSGTQLIEVSVRVPMSVRNAVVHLPLLGLKGHEVKAYCEHNLVWNRGEKFESEGPCKTAMLVTANDGDDVLELHSGPGHHTFVVIVA